MNLLTEHPFWTGFGLTIILIVCLVHVLADSMTPQQTRATGLMVFGGALTILMRYGMDRDRVFWFFIGGVAGIFVSLVIV